MKRNNYYHRALFTQADKKQPLKKKWRIHYVLWTALKRLCMLYGALLLAASAFGALAYYSSSKSVSSPMLPSEMVLYLPLENAMVEHENQLGPYGFSDKYLAIRDVVGALDHAATDERVKGFVMKLDGGALSLSHIEELREAVARFKQSGKFAYIYSLSYSSLGQYYLASSFEQIWLQPMGVVSLPGIHAEIPYARELLDKLGIEPQMFARKEYKNIFESVTDTQMSKETNEVMSKVIDDYMLIMGSAIEQDRSLESFKFKALVDKGLLTDKEAVTGGLIDKLDYIDRFNAHIKQTVLGDAESDEKIFTPVARYIKDSDYKRSQSGALSKKPKVGLIYAVGSIMSNSNNSNSLGAADTLVKAIREAGEDEDLKVIVLRIDSPGGDPIAAESIRRAIIVAKEKGKKIVVSMGASAASGGYWIAADADRIFALPTTFTGSIGVAGGKFSLQGFWDTLGVNWDSVSRGQNSGIWSFNEPYSESEISRMNVLMDNIYDSFIERVAKGRSMSISEVETVAGGRVWTGYSAKDVGLVDELGGLDKALDYTAGLVGEKNRFDISVDVLPRPKTAFEKVIELLDAQVRMGEFFNTNISFFDNVSALIGKFKSSFGLSPYQAQSYYQP